MKLNKGKGLITIIIMIIVFGMLVTLAYYSMKNEKIPIQVVNDIENIIKKFTASNSKTTFKLSASGLNQSLTLYTAKQYAENPMYDSKTLNATKWDGTENKIPGTIKQYIPIISKEYGNKFEIKSGELMYVGSDKNERQWFADSKEDMLK